MASVAARVSGTAVGLGVTVLGLVCSVVLALPAVLVGADAPGTIVVALVLSELGFAVAALAFVWLTGRGLASLNLRRPTRRDVAAVILGLAALFAVRTVGILLVQLLGLPVGGNSIGQLVEQGFLVVLLMLIPVSVLVVGPSEELLFRNVVQKYLYGSFSRSGAVVVASVLFALAHLPTTLVATSDPVAVGTAVGLIFAISLVLGVLYARTDSVVVVALVHGFYDAVVFAAAYFALVGQKLV